MDPTVEIIFKILGVGLAVVLTLFLISWAVSNFVNNTPGVNCLTTKGQKTSPICWVGDAIGTVSGFNFLRKKFPKLGAPLSKNAATEAEKATEEAAEAGGKAGGEAEEAAEEAAEEIGELI